MADLVWHHLPNRVVTKETPGDTSWHQVTEPAGLPPKSGRANVLVGVCTLAAAGGAGSLPLVNFDLPTAPSIGWPVLTVQIFGVNNSMWYQLTSATDTIYFLWGY